MYARMADAAFAGNIPPGFDIAAGYYGGPNAYHVWHPSDWARFPGFKLPIWVGGLAGEDEGREAVAELKALGVPAGSRTVLDLEDRKDITYVEAFGDVLRAAGYLVEPYGSAGEVFGNPPLNGYWVADYGLTAPQLDNVLQQGHVRAVQFEKGAAYDSSLVKPWTESEMWHG